MRVEGRWEVGGATHFNKVIWACVCTVWTHQQVFRFDVSVDNVEAVEVFDGIGQIVEHAAGVSLRVSVGRGDGVEQISALRASQDDYLS